MMTASLSIIAGQYSEKGIKPFNEDSCGIKVPDDNTLRTKGIALIIADGVSSSEAGREASEACVKGFFSDYYSTPESWTVKTSGQKIFGAINRWLYGQSQKLHHSGQGMLTTMSAMIIKSTTAHLFHVGDSRIYRFDGLHLERLTRDHVSWVSEEKSFLARAMGADINVDVDYRSLPVVRGDIFLLVTDGVYEFVHTQDLIRLLQRFPGNPDRAAREIVTLALANGSHDNVTAQVCRIENLPDESEQEFFRKLTELPFPPPLEAGNVIDGFKILREIHASHRTQVYLAEDQHSAQKVVIKTPSINFEDEPNYIDGFLNEEWVGRRINNPHVLKVIKIERPRHFLYYVTEYIEGQTLRQWMNDNPKASIQTVRPIIEQLISAVRAFQRLEMVHQDLKPENIMLDKHGTVKVIDFGSTKIAGIEEIESPVSHGNLLGTLDYAAPEFFLGDPGTHESDIYAVGVITYEMLCGRLPYGGPLTKKSIKNVTYMPAFQFNPEVPAWIDAALEKSVLINPARRYSTLSEFLMDLTKPNASLSTRREIPLIEKYPLQFWKLVSFLLLAGNLLLAYLLFTRD